MGIKDVTYNYDAKTNVAEIIIKRPAHYMVQYDWYSLGDSQIITALPEEYFYPTGIGPRHPTGVGKNDGLFIVFPYLDDLYVQDESLKRYAKVYIAKQGVADIALEHTDEELRIKFVGKKSR